jgi:Site-specific DNA methylase
MTNFEIRRVSPLPPAAAYIGGKKQLAKRIVSRIEDVTHDSYVEPFIGMGGVFLRRRFAPRSEVINDLNGDVATFFRILQRHYVPFMDMLRFQFTGRREFERLLATDPATLTDLERAVRFLYLQRTAYGGKVAGRSFGVSPGMPGRFDVSKLGQHLADLSERLSGVVIENLPYGELIDRYDAPQVLFYLDPPYYGSEDDYGRGAFERTDFTRLASILGRLRGKFILSLNDRPEVRAIFSGFDMETVALTYTINGASPQHAQELIISTKGLQRERRQPALL